MNKTSNKLFSLTTLKVERNLPEIIVVTSGKGGVGKTFFSVNLAVTLSRFKKKILLIDADIHLGNVDLFLGLRTKYSIADVISGEKNLSDVIIKGPGGIDILPASSAVKDLLDEEDAALQRLHQAFSKFEHEYDKVVVDTGAGISKNVMSFVLGADKIFLVVTPDPASIADAYGMIKIILQNQEYAPILVMANMVKNEAEGESLYSKMNLMVQRFLNSQIYFGGYMLKDPLVADSIKMQKPLVISHPYSAPNNLIRMALRRIIGAQGKDSSQRKGFFNRVIENRNLSV
ncbi:MAG: MinD/ParA family protein [Candidatus Marinimicrobia bacterium]|nr:MinD/ParA family protein [Candidatus Neomarinimicrobiota bacterium]